MKRIFILVFLLSFSWLSWADDSLLMDIMSGKYKAKTLPSYTSMADGERYAQLKNGQVFAYSFKTGNQTDTLYSGSEKFEGFILSPNERFMLLYKNCQNIFRRSTHGEYYIYDILKKKIKPLTEDNDVQTAIFSPDSRYIAFSRANNLFIHKLDFGTEVAVTTDGEVGKIINGTPDWLYEEEFSTTCLFAFSPDSKQLAFVRLDESEVPTFRWQEFLDSRYPKDYSLKYPKSGEQNATASVVVYDTHYKSLKTMKIAEDGEFYIPRIFWTNSSEQLAICKLNRNQNKLEIFIANPKSTETRLLYKEECKDYCVNYEALDELQFLSDNSMIVVNETDGYRHAYLYSPMGQKQKQLTSGKYDVTHVYGYDETTSTLYYQAADKSPMQRNIYALNVKKNKITALTPAEGTHKATFSTGFKYFVDQYQSMTKAPTYTLYTNAGKVVRELLNNNEVQKSFDSLNLPQKEMFSFTNERGDELKGWMIKPLNFDENKQYPALQVQYSGPASQLATDTWKIDWEYFLASQGILIVCVDPRGTDARGTEWRKRTYMNIGVMEAQDQVSVAHYLASLPYIKADKIGIWGWSYGGFMALMSLTEPNSPFCCGISVAPVTDFRLYDSAYTERYMRTPQQNWVGFDATNLCERAQNLNAKLLLVHGVADDNVHCQQAWNFVNALVENNKQFEMQFYPDDNHFLKKRNNYLHLYQRKWNFIKENLLGE